MRDKMLVLGLSAVIVLGALYLKKKVFIKKEELKEEFKETKTETTDTNVVTIQVKDEN